MYRTTHRQTERDTLILYEADWQRLNLQCGRAHVDNIGLGPQSEN